ncbi:MAG: DUF4194 domain-containing protein [Bacilli bacterium]|jgi:hypothetical protein
MGTEQILQLSRQDQEEFARVVNNLLLTSFCVRDYYDRREKTIKINPDFRFIERHFDLISDYLSFSGWTIEKDLISGVFNLINDYGQNRVRFDRETSLILFVLRLIYETEKSESNVSADSIYLTTPLVLKVMHNRGITMPGKKVNGRLIGRSLRILSTYNIIDKVSGSYDEGNVSFYLLPSIKYAVDSDKIVAMSNALEELAIREEQKRLLEEGEQ